MRGGVISFQPKAAFKALFELALDSPKGQGAAPVTLIAPGSVNLLPVSNCPDVCI
jgi:hypothetical protein